MNVLILILIGIILFKLLYNPECFNIGIQNASKKIYISKTLSLQDCNSNPIPSCSDDLLNHYGKCYRLLNKNDNLWFLTKKHPWIEKNILMEIKNNKNNDTEYTILRASGKFKDIFNKDFDETSSFNLFIVNLFETILYLFSLDDDEYENIPFPKFLSNDIGDIIYYLE